MKIRSHALYHYLLEANVLHGHEDAIVCAKNAYRKLYKRQWKKQAQPRKEIRFTVTLKQLADIKATARARNIRHSTYAKHAVLDSIGQPVVHNEQLLTVLQLVSMAAIAIEQHQPYRVVALVQQAETILLNYLTI